MFANLKSRKKNRVTENNVAITSLKSPDLVVIQTSSLFDDAWYIAQYPDVKNSTLSAAQHYLEIGAKLGYDPGPDFSTEDYRSLYLDVRQENPLIHYERVGKIQGRCINLKNSSREKAITITFLSGAPNTSSHVNRVEHYAKAARSLGAATVVLTLGDVTTCLESIAQSKILIVWRIAWNESLAAVFALARAVGTKIIFDTDNLLTDPEANTATANYYEALQKTLLESDYCTTSTQSLAEHIAQFGKRVVVLPDGFDQQTWQTARMAVRAQKKLPTDGLIRLGYVGDAKTNHKDFALIADSITRVLRENSNCRLVLFRHNLQSLVDINKFPTLNTVSAQIEWREIVDLTEFPWELARFDIHLLPSEIGNQFSEAKSELAFVEAALVEIPTVASPTQSFSLAIEEDETGFLAEKEEDWYTLLLKLIRDVKLRKKIGRNAYFNVLYQYGAGKRIELMQTLKEMILYPGIRAARAFKLQLLNSEKNPHKPPVVPEYEILFSYDQLRLSEITAVIPLHNDRKYLLETLDSIKTQNVGNIDLIIVDDCTTNNSFEIVNEWIIQNKERFNRIIFVKNKVDSGLALTRDVGFSLAETFFVVALNSDTILWPDFSSHCLQKIKETEAAFAYPSIKLDDEESKQSKLIGAEEFDPLFLASGKSIESIALIRLSVWSWLGGYDPLKSGSEDYDFWCKAVEAGFFGVHVNEILAKQYLDTKSTASEAGAELNRRHPWLKINLHLDQ